MAQPLTAIFYNRKTYRDMEETRKHELEKEINALQVRFEQALNEGVEFSALKKIWLDLKSMQEQWRLLFKTNT